MVHALGTDDLHDSLQNNLKIQQERTMSQIIDIEFNLLRNWNSSRPLICAQPVNPGVNTCTPFWERKAIKSFWLKRAGRGPTMLISPTRMLQSCGSSSRLDLRKNLPAGVNQRAESTSRCVASAGVSMRMVRNFGILKITLRPTRSDQKRSVPGEGES